MTDRTDAFEISSGLRAALAPPVFPPGCYRAASRNAVSGPGGVPDPSLPASALALGKDSIASRAPGGVASTSPDRAEVAVRSPEELAEALESLARELRRRGGEALFSSPGAPRLETDLRKLASRFLSNEGSTG